MIQLRHAALPVALVALSAVLSHAVHVSAQVDSLVTREGVVVAPKEASPAAAPAAEVNPAHVAMLGSGAPPDRVQKLSVLLAIPPQDGQTASSVPPFFSLLKDTGTPGSPKFEVSGTAFDLQLGMYPPLRVENARVALMPSADGRTCRFELSGSPFGPSSKIEATGTIEWASGPSGGDKLDVVYRLDDASVEAIRTWVPTRMDPSFGGLLDAHGKASGVVGETTTEVAPATPLKGDFEATLDWTAIGRTAPMTIRSQFSLDDRMVRLVGGRMTWLEEALDLKGWVKPGPNDEYELIASFKDVDTAAVATRWNVPEQWRPASTLSGQITMKGTPGKGLLRHEATAPLITVPALGGYDIRVEEAKLAGSLVAINAEVAVSVRAKRTIIGGIDLGNLPIGIRWWEKKVVVSNSNSALFGGENDGSLAWEPAKHPRFSVSGRVKNADAPLLVKSVVPWLDLEVDGKGSIAFSLGQDEVRTPLFAFHGSLSQGRIGGADLFGATIAALTKADPALTLPAGTVPVPRKGAGTRVDRWFFEADRQGEAFDIGGLFLQGGDFRLDGDGQYTRAGGVKLDGTVAIPKAAADQLIAAAPWAAALRKGESLFVPVVVSGPLSKMSVELAPGFADVLAKAKKGEPVEATGIRNVKHVGPDNLATIPLDPAAEIPQ